MIQWLHVMKLEMWKKQKQLQQILMKKSNL